MDLVEWHAPILIIETRMSGAKAVEMIESMPFDGSVVADTISFTGGAFGCSGGLIWCKWKSWLQLNKRSMPLFG